jgi:hypothetical protein
MMFHDLEARGSNGHKELPSILWALRTNVNRATRVLVVVKPNRIIRKRTNANCSIFHLRVFLGLSNPQGQRQTSTLSIPRDNFGERKAKFNLGSSRTTQI